MSQIIDMVILKKVPALMLFQPIYMLLRVEDVPAEKERAEKQDISSISETNVKVVMDDTGQMHLSIACIKECLDVDVRMRS